MPARILFAFVFTLIWSFALGQTTRYFPNTSFPDSTLSYGSCPYDASKQIWMYDGFQVYQTLDNTPNGTIDSSYCIGMGKDGNHHYVVDGWSSAPSRPIFIKWKPTATIQGQPFTSHSLIEFETYIHSERENHFNDSTNCAFGNCLSVSSGIRKQVTVDSQIVSLIESDLDYASSTQNGTYASFRSKCHPSEKYDSIAYDSLMITVQLTASDSFRISHNISNAWSEAFFMDTAQLEFARVDSSSYRFDNSFGGSFVTNYLFGHYVPGTPSNNNVAYFDFSPSPNTDSATSVTVVFEEYVTLVTESFIQFRGGLPFLDSNRHTLNVVNNGADNCLYWFGERVFGKNTNLIHKKGGFYPENGACTMFNSGSKLIVDKNSQLFYGYDGKGMLAIKPESEIRLREGSTLSMSTLLVLIDDQFSAHNRYRIVLPKGSTLEFREGSRINTQFCANSDTKIEIMLQGGSINLSGLDDESRQKVLITFPKLRRSAAEELVLKENPVTMYANIEIDAFEEELMPILIYSMDGQVVQSSLERLHKGKNQLSVFVGDLAPGTYLVRPEFSPLNNALRMIKL